MSIKNAIIYSSSGGGGCKETGDYLVQFIDSVNGDILKYEWVDSGDDATAPTTIPTHTGLTFEKWSESYTNVTNDMYIGAVYKTTDSNKTYIYLNANDKSSNFKLNPTLSVNKPVGTMTIDWGDGDTSINTDSGSTSESHTYVTGEYIISIDFDDYYEYQGINVAEGISKIYFSNYVYSGSSLSQHSLLEVVLSSKMTELPSLANSSIKSIYIPSGVTSTSYTFLSSTALKYIFESSITDCGRNSFRDTPLKYFKFEKLTNIGLNAFQYTHVEKIILSGCTLDEDSFASSFVQEVEIYNINTLTNGCFEFCDVLRTVYIDENITNIEGSCFIYCYNLFDVQCLATTPPTMGTYVFYGDTIINIYVPDASVSAYKAATNWSTWSDFIFPISTRP